MQESPYWRQVPEDRHLSGECFMKTRLKSTRSAERRKVELAVKYSEQGSATGGGHRSQKKLRKQMEARFLPVYQAMPKATNKKKKGRRRTPA